MTATLFLVLVLLGSPPQARAQAQEQATTIDQTSPTVVVTGRRTSRAKALRHMTSAVTPVVDASRPLARF